jgi:hypothetical protein
MTQISSLHELAQSGLHELANRRVMPSGYDRSLSRRADLMTRELGPLLTAVLATKPDVLMPRPPHARWQSLIAMAVPERRLKDMVLRWVALLDAEPKPDQETACALATTREQVAGAARLLGRLEALREELDEAQVIINHCRFGADLDLGDTRDAVDNLMAQAQSLQLKLNSYEDALAEDIQA